MPENSRGAALLLGAFFLAMVCYAGYRLHGALTPFILAAAFAYVLNPLVNYFEARGLRRLHLVCVAYFVTAVILFVAYVGLRTFFVDEFIRLNTNAPIYFKNIQKLTGALGSRITRALPLPATVSSKALESVLSNVFDWLQALPSQALGLVPWLLHGLLVPFIGFFFLIDASDTMGSLIQATPSRLVEQALHLIGEIDNSLGGYLRGILITSGVIAAASFFGLVILEIDNALVIAALSGICSVVPYLGAAVGIVVGGAMGWYQLGSIWGFVKVALFFFGIRVADEIFLQPLISRHSVHLHPMVSLLVLVIGAEMFGFMGLVFAVPAACIVKSLFKVTWSWYASASSFELPIRPEYKGVPYI